MSPAETAAREWLTATMHCENVPGIVASLLAQIDCLRAERDVLMMVLEPLLVAVEPVRYALLREIDKQVELRQEWAKKYNVTRGNSNEMWFYNTEFRQSLEREVEPCSRAIREANEVYDRIKGQASCSE